MQFLSKISPNNRLALPILGLHPLENPDMHSGRGLSSFILCHLNCNNSCKLDLHFISDRFAYGHNLDWMLLMFKIVSSHTENSIHWSVAKNCSGSRSFSVSKLNIIILLILFSLPNITFCENRDYYLKTSVVQKIRNEIITSHENTSTSSLTWFIKLSLINDELYFSMWS